MFEFLTSNTDTKPFLDHFLSTYGHNDWKFYVRAYLGLVKSLINGEGSILDLQVDEGDDETRKFVENFIIQDEKALDDYDFRSVRSNPLYKLEKGRYRVIYALFVVEGIFTGLYFNLSALYKKQKKELQTLGEFRGFYTTNFSENYLLYKTLKACFPKSHIHISGEEFRSQGVLSEPDYYIRNKNKIFIFENKDVLMPAEVKQSCDYNKLEAELRKRFYVDETGKKKKNGAVLQLINNIKLILTDQFSSDKLIKSRNVTIFPILVLHYNQYNAPGLNQIVNYWFQSELAQLSNEKVNVSNVQPLIIIDIDTLIILQDYLINRRILLEHLIQDYGKALKSKDHIMPFANFIMEYANKKRFNKPPVVLEGTGLKLFRPG